MRLESGAGFRGQRRKLGADGFQSQNPSRRRNALLIATAACAPSPMATATRRTSRETSPATYIPGTLLSSVSGSITTPPLSFRLQPRRFDKSEAWWQPVEKNSPERASAVPFSNRILVSSPSAHCRDWIGSERKGMLYSLSFRAAFVLTSVPSLQVTTSEIQCFIIIASSAPLSPVP